MNYSRGAGQKQQGKKKKKFIPDGYMSWNGYPAPGRGMWQETNSLAVTTYCAMHHTQDRNSCFPSMQYYFLPVHSFNHHRCLKSRAGGGFTMLVLTFFSDSIVELIEMVV